MRGELSSTEPIDKVNCQLLVRIIEETVLEKSIIADNNVAALTNLSRHHHTKGLNGIVTGSGASPLIVFVQSVSSEFVVVLVVCALIAAISSTENTGNP